MTVPPSSPTRRTVRRGAVDIAFWTSGPPEAQPILLLHPIGLDHHAFDAVAERVVDRFRLVLPDLRGHGETRADATEVRLPAMARDVLAVLDAFAALDTFGPDRLVHLAGHSMGGVVAALAAASAPRRFASLHLIATPAEGGPVFRERGQAALRSGMPGVVESTLRRWFTQESLTEGLPGVEYARSRVLAMAPEAWAAAWSSMAGFPGFGEIGARLPRTYCVSAGQDVSTPPSVLTQVADAIPASVAHHVVPGAGHLLTLERPAAVASLLADDWELSGQPAGGTGELA
ncbi:MULTISPECIES: alpha/beta fold hydrolase [Actinoalloteichus]|uniref:Hydrolase or acyltransferase of alpha/beta superfamily n=1 Tax=Actinoalloteichus fjordicus TaxID=1612552 RepID=A0AAC9LHK0_9PSEU|nr:MULTISPECIES: alpha/beta fold hydrolase [Actinoalloteichus]APU16480.1 putative hydrolase or acyltransferase of alpha/beta superfamily [Actinoalloteichus fjordicus]APU22539.1 putative hydrolase or acyltransferase of alpha/beta superfamily [Actinoalloteichus sp. GBA129-24]